MRLGLDIGTRSIGWWLYATENGEPNSIIAAGVRIFSDGRVPKSGSSLAVDRRIARAARRRRDRYLQRRAMLMKRLAVAGLMPGDPSEAKKLAQLDPYALRAEGLDAALPLVYFGRALFHLNQRRGFKSNRKTDGGNNEAGKITLGTARLDQEMIATGARTYGEFLHKRRQTAPTPRETPPVRTRLTLSQDADTEKPVEGYDFYPGRANLEEEFHKLWAAQATHHSQLLTDSLRDTLFETIFHQRPLKTPAVGRCLFVDEPRLPKAHPLTQQRVLYETVNGLRVTAPGLAKRRLTPEERDTVILALNTKKPTKSLSSAKLTLKALAKALKLTREESFTLETHTRDAIACDPVRASLSHPDRFGSAWSTLDTDAQWTLVQKLRDIELDKDVLIAWLTEVHQLDKAHADMTADAPLPEGYARLGETATRRILEALKSGVLNYNDAVAACSWHHSSDRTGEVLDALPYYGEILDRHVIPGSQEPDDDDITRYGRITNPTVHIGLNQLRRLVNRIIKVHGKPDQIIVELARELKQSEDQKLEINKVIKRNTEAAIQRGRKLEELGQPNTGANRIVLRLWEELSEDPLKRSCPYTGERISAGMLFTGACDIDHILPYSRTLDDGISNRTLCLRKANREKRNRTPWEIWGETPRWEKIAANLHYLPENKRWRFAPDAMERFEGERDFLDRALVDTQYLSRIARQYLDALYTEGGHVWVVPGRLTEMLRRHWGLNSLLPDHNRGAVKKKNRLDHRHHAIDAAVVGATDRALVKKIADSAKENREGGLEVLAASIPPPWEHFRADIETQLNRIVVSHRADHGRIDLTARKRGKDITAGRLHNDTAYGLTGETHNGGVLLVVTRKPIDSLTPAMIGKIRDPQLQMALTVSTSGKEGKDFDAAVKAFAARPGPYCGIRRVRIIEPASVIEIRDDSGRPYKGYKGDSNHCYEVWQMPDGNWTHHVVSTFDAHQGAATRPHPAAKRIMRLHKNDALKLDDSKFGPVIVTVEKFDANGGISLVTHTESNADQRYRQKNDDVYIRLTPGSLKNNGARRIYIDEIGRIRDAGHHDRR